MKHECGCELTDKLIFKPCKKHWQLLHDSVMFKALTGGEIDMDTDSISSAILTESASVILAFCI